MGFLVKRRPSPVPELMQQLHAANVTPSQARQLGALSPEHALELIARLAERAAGSPSPERGDPAATSHYAGERGGTLGYGDEARSPAPVDWQSRVARAALAQRDLKLSSSLPEREDVNALMNRALVQAVQSQT